MSQGAIKINAIKRYRVNREMSQVQLAKACGVSQGTIVGWEQGKSFPKAPKLKKLAEIFEVTADELLKEVN